MVEDKNEKILLEDNHIDDHVDDEIQQCLSTSTPKSFFMFAGAGSGKTRSLVNALSFLDKEFGQGFSANAKQIAVITYTNAACDEISRRLQYKPIFAVSTIHSFLWELIKNYQIDIKKWVIASLKQDISELNEKQAKRYNANRDEDIKRKTKRLDKSETVNRFSYNPNGDNVGYDSLNHSEVIKMGSEFITSEDTMQKILINKFPVLLIDESQDTKKELVDALFIVCEKYKQNFIVGMFGDTMQKIYMDGKDNLASCVPDDWAQPKKLMNHRSATRIVELANVIRSSIDGQKQKARSDAVVGTVRLFIAPSSSNKETVERQVAKTMAKTTEDKDWGNESEYKSLILEHHMAASRFGFIDLYAPLSESGAFDTSLRDGSIAELSFLSKVIAPLVMAHKNNNEFEIAKIVRQHSPLLDKKVLAVNSDKQTDLLQKAENAVDNLLALWTDNNIPKCLDIIKSVQEIGLFKVSDCMDYILAQPMSGDEKTNCGRNSCFSRIRTAHLEKFRDGGVYCTSRILHELRRRL